ncbi:potassium channel family protein [Neolewinella persica]|uniref:potassium channel family protein n=1 Tax=Neolewinella persica TaxID=70998 RepID=UPI00037EBCBA|nr:potassium channel family protein [Neolewinella persica]
MQVIYQIQKRAKKARRALGSTLKYRILFLALFLLSLMCLHMLAMVIFEGIGLGDAAWLTITTATTVGYGDISASSTAGRWSTAILMYAGGIFVLAQLAGLIFEASQWRVTQRQQGKLAIRARGHIVIFGWREDFLVSAIREVRESISPLNDEDIVIVSPNIELLPDVLRDLDVHHVSGPFYEATVLAKANIQRAARLVIIPDTDEPEADFVNLDLVNRLRKEAPDTPIIMACLRQEMEPVAEKMGVTEVLTFGPNYPDMLTRAVLAIGAEKVVEELIVHAGAEMVVIHLPLRGSVGQILGLTDSHAILLGYRKDDGQYAVHPAREDQLEDNVIIFLVDVDPYGSAAAAEKTLVALLQPLVEDRTIRSFDEPKSLGIIGGRNRVNAAYLRALQRQLGTVEVSHLCEDCWQEEGLSTMELKELEAVILLSDDPGAPDSDARTFVTINYLRRELGYTGRLIVEGVLTENRTRFEAAGATDVIRPVTQNLDILARCILTGAEEILDSLYSSYGPQELIRMEMELNTDWLTFCRSVYSLALPLAFEDTRGRVVVPPPDYQLGKGQVYMLVDRAGELDYWEVREALRGMVSAH